MKRILKVVAVLSLLLVVACNESDDDSNSVKDITTEETN
mgnify:CR=1 FL=1